MNNRPIAIVVQGLFEKSDSIGYDAVFEYKLLLKTMSDRTVKLFSERVDRAVYSDLTVHSMAEFWNFLDSESEAIVIYHFCDGWSEIDDFICSSSRPFIVRWHNNTPPWFYGASHRRSVERTVRGFRTITRLAQAKNVRFWANSNFTFDQLKMLGGTPEQISVVFPGSRFLEGVTQFGLPVYRSSDRDQTETLNLLFVSRVVAHKGHRHVIRLAAYLQEILRRVVTVTFIGRDDPSSGLAGELSDYAKKSGVSMTLTGEVDEEYLRAAYREADLFVCFSEHEGFGMPIFEAMRTGVPVMCWGGTALRELMEQHPFTFDEIDLPRAAAAITVLEDPSACSEVLRIQDQLLELYSAKILSSQISAAIDGSSGRWPLLGLTDTQAQQAIRARVEEIRHRFPECIQQNMLPTDLRENFVTLYDLESYEALLLSDHGIAKLSELPAALDHAFLSFREFMAPTAIKVEEGISFSGLHSGPTTYAIYGPYVKFVRGYFSAEFKFEVERSGDPSVELELDVAVEGEGMLASAKVDVSTLKSHPTVRLLFPVSRESSVLEFRVKVVRHGNCGFLFKGVTIRNMRQSLVGLRESDQIADVLPKWMPGRHGRKRPILSFSEAASKHFALADRCRDKGLWNDAAEGYSSGLKLEPGAFNYIVQRANCLKEAERFEESERSYLEALEIKPNDRDANLQLGRLYRLMGNSEAAYFHLLRAASLEVPAANAMHELAGLGFDISSLPNLFV